MFFLINVTVVNDHCTFLSSVYNGDHSPPYFVSFMQGAQRNAQMHINYPFGYRFGGGWVVRHSMYCTVGHKQ
jgi:hypothetical protein